MQPGEDDDADEVCACCAVGRGAQALEEMGAWDYIINLSSTDLPLRTRSEMLEVLGNPEVPASPVVVGVSRVQTCVGNAVFGFGDRHSTLYQLD